MWINQNISPCPFDTRIIWTDGKTMAIGQISKMFDDGKTFWYSHAVEGVSGYDWEEEVSYPNITHWQLAPEFPKE